MKQDKLFEEIPLEKAAYHNHTCDECEHIYFKKLLTKKVRKCDIKPRGWGYDIKKNHVACRQFKPTTKEAISVVVSHR